MEVARRAWGCDAPTDEDSPVFTVPCSACAGGERLPDGAVECPDCEGSGEVAFHRCPTALMESLSPWEIQGIEAIMRCYLQYDARHVMPVAGGFGDQSPAFARYVEILDGEKGRYEGMRQEKLEKDRKAAEMKSKRGGGRASAFRRPPTLPARRPR